MNAKLIGILTLAIINLNQLSARDVSVAVPAEGAPLAVFKDGQLSGAIGDVAKIVFAKMDLTPKCELVPFARLFATLHDGTVDSAVRVLASEERKKLAYYSDPIISEYQLVVVAKGKSFPFARISDLNGKTVGTINGFIYPTIDHVATITKEPANNNVANVKKLLVGRVDAIIVNSIFGLQALEEAKLLDQVEVLETAIAPAPLGMALSKKAFQPADLEAMNKIIKDVLNSPEWTAIKEKNALNGKDKPYPLAKP